jgi:hypothetical protein
MSSLYEVSSMTDEELEEIAAWLNIEEEDLSLEYIIRKVCFLTPCEERLLQNASDIAEEHLVGILSKLGNQTFGNAVSARRYNALYMPVRECVTQLQDLRVTQRLSESAISQISQELVEMRQEKMQVHDWSRSHMQHSIYALEFFLRNLLLRERGLERTIQRVADQGQSKIPHSHASAQKNTILANSVAEHSAHSKDIRRKKNHSPHTPRP